MLLKTDSLRLARNSFIDVQSYEFINQEKIGPLISIYSGYDESGFAAWIFKGLEKCNDSETSASLSELAFEENDEFESSDIASTRSEPLELFVTAALKK